ncbi:MAG: alpha/beta fold hydrolase [Cyanobacteria bacterium P01_F01_bin.116]
MNNWIICPQPRPHAKIKLVCFAYAGGSGWIFRNWAEHFPDTVEVCAIELPGRGRRISEPVLTGITPLIHTLGPELLPSLNSPFVCFGHSLGALVAFELCRWLRHVAQLTPLQIWASAARAPHLSAETPPIHGLPEPAFINELRRYQGTPASVLNNTELMALMLPALRADFSILETYQYQPGPKLSCPIIGFWGQQDTIVSKNEVLAWQIHTDSFSMEEIHGDHFFMHQPTFLQKLGQNMADLL